MRWATGRHSSRTRPSAGATTWRGLTRCRLSVTDDDEAGLAVSEASITVGEAGGTATYTVALAVRPTDAVTVTAASSDTSVAAVSPATLTFTAEDWDVERTVTVTGADDRALGDRTARITHSAIGGGYELAGVDTVAVAVTDDDEAGLAVSDTAVTVGEAGGTATYAVALAVRPTGAVTVTAASSDTSAATVSPTVLEFTAEDWDGCADGDGDGRGRRRLGRPGGARHALGGRRRLRPRGRRHGGGGGVGRRRGEAGGCRRAR